MKKLLCLFLMITLLLTCQKQPAEKITIATAANMQFAMKELVQAFTEETGLECETIISSSGKLTAQIMLGAPYDIFVSADLKYPTTLFENGKTLEAPKVYAYGYLVLWTMKGGSSLGLNKFQSASIRHIALANPKIAPYGKAAMEILSADNALLSYGDKLVYGESIAQVNQFIMSQSADVGFTAKSMVMTPEMKGQGYWEEIPSNLYSPIKQGIALLKTNPERQSQAQKFYNFLFSAKAKEILDNFGYGVEIE